MGNRIWANVALKILASALTLVLAVGMSGCAKVHVHADRYTPQFQSDLSHYRGKRVYLMWVVNTDNNTTIWDYYSEPGFDPEKRLTYECAPSTEGYFWRVMAKAFRTMGMLVSHPDTPDTWAPGVRVTAHSMTDEHFFVEVEVHQRGVKIYTKQYRTTEPPLKGKLRTEANLEKRAYRMVTGLVEMIFTDVQFRSAFARAITKRR